MDLLSPFGSAPYFLFLCLLVFSRGMDFLSTWIATPNLLLEANPIARKLGWRMGIMLNGVLCFAFAAWPLPAIVIITTSLLVAARNLQSAWLMRSLGEDQYRLWIRQRVKESRLGLYLFCLLTQTALIASVGATVMGFSDYGANPDWSHLVPFAVGAGIVTFAVVVTVYTLLSLWRLRRSQD
jgi:hypothetical protein